MAEARYELTELEINEGSLVDKGDNPEAHVRLFKMEDGEEAHEPAQDEPATPEVSKGKGVLRKLWERIAGTGTEEVAKDYARTTAEILRSDRLEHDFAKLRLAFMESVDSILECAEGAEMAGLLETAVSEFNAEAGRITADIGKASQDSADELRGILDAMIDSVSKGDNEAPRPEVRAEFAKAVADLEAFEVPKAPQEEKESMTTEKNLDSVLAALPEGDRAIIDAELAKIGHDGKKKPYAGKEEEEEDEMKKSAEPSNVEKRMIELEKRAELAEAKVAALVEKERSAEFLEVAKRLVPGGVDHADLGAALKTASDFDPDFGANLEKLFGALGAQVEKSSLFSVVGSEAPVGKSSGSDAHAKLEARAAELKKSANDRGERMTSAEAYDLAMNENPQLALEAVG